MAQDACVRGLARMQRDGDVGELLVLVPQLGALGRSVDARPGDADGEVTPLAVELGQRAARTRS
jgi:hypothetical protein